MFEGGDGDGGGGGFGFGGLGFGKMSKKKMKKILMELNEANRNHSIKSKERKVLMHEQGRSIEELSRQVSRLQLAVKHHDVALQQQKEIMELKSEENLKNSEEMHRKELVSSGYLVFPLNTRSHPTFSSSATGRVCQ